MIPGAPEVVHHLGIYIDTEGKALKLDKETPGLGFRPGISFSSYNILDVWAPGGTPQYLAPGTAFKIPAGSHIVMDMHYMLDGEVHFDRTQIGFYFPKGPIDKHVRLGVVGNRIFEIPPGESRYEVTAKGKIRDNIHLISAWPHMHFLGKEMKVWATLPSGVTEPIVWVQDYKYTWQEVYVLEEPLALPDGSSIGLSAFYDNTAENPLNPHKKPRIVRFGQRAENEMCYFYYYYTVDEEHISQGIIIE